MKRSEAVEIIRKILSKHEDDQLMPIHYIDSLSCELLCVVEESIGMLPPGYITTKEMEIGFIGTVPYSKIIQQWEDENEEK